KPYSDLYPNAGSFLLNSERVSERVIVLPAGPEMDDERVDRVVSIIRVLTSG
ncbi:MAG: DegT/DnrJ/EryC1/StrS family aminotransferase, partial [Candidatus Thiodiazotropha endolucinida]|nr:DegT/DnrJ/EryC1/StrS family aminotransferase [Candidatus Thiodiazotropha taylori]MCW4237744.1 DegT/DnrJ/EryC1/StrS family aminotransferase [Candidatus Thiodiazotropha endolucinida]